MIVLFVSYLAIPPSENLRKSSTCLETHEHPAMSITERFDFLGCVTGVSGLVLVNFAVNQAPIVGWENPYILNLLVLGILLFCAFVAVEFRFAQQPLIPIGRLHKESAVILLCIAFGWASHGIWYVQRRSFSEFGN